VTVAVAQPFTCAGFRGRWRFGGRRGSQTAENFTSYAWRQGRLAAARRSDCFGERVGTNVLEQIAGGPGLNRAKDELVVVECGEHQKLNIGPAPFDVTRCSYTIHARHPQVHEDHALGGLATLVMGAGVSVAGTAVTNSEVSVGSPPNVVSQSHQNEPAVAIDAHNPDVLVAGAIDKIDQQPCPRTLVVVHATCEVDGGVGVSGVYFSFDRGRHWTQPTYTGWTGRDCDSETVCAGHFGPIGRIPWYYESGLVDIGDPAVAVGPRPVDGKFSWANGARVYYANLTTDFPGSSTLKGFSGIAVSRLDDPTPERVAQKTSWMRPVIISRQSSVVFNDKEQVWADNAESSPYFGRVYSCYNAFRSKGQHVGTENEALPMIVSSSAPWREHLAFATDLAGRQHRFGAQRVGDSRVYGAHRQPRNRLRVRRDDRQPCDHREPATPGSAGQSTAFA
jgi:hypothetical protein